jgi:hypothetical protein
MLQSRLLFKSYHIAVCANSNKILFHRDAVIEQTGKIMNKDLK